MTNEEAQALQYFIEENEHKPLLNDDLAVVYISPDNAKFLNNFLEEEIE